MPAMQPPTGPIEVSDPNNVPELYGSGPFNIMNAGGMVRAARDRFRRLPLPGVRAHR